MLKRKYLFRNVVKKISNQNESKKSTKNFESGKTLDKLKFLIIIVRRGHGVAISDLLIEHGVAMSAISFAQGTRGKYVVDIFGSDEQHKEIITAVVSAKRYNDIKKALQYRFNVSGASKGVLLTFDISACAGVSAYKYLSDFEGVSRYGKKD